MLGKEENEAQRMAWEVGVMLEVMHRDDKPRKLHFPTLPIILNVRVAKGRIVETLDG